MKKTGELFDEWNDKKKNIELFEKSQKRTDIWEIWIENVWVNIWSEISKDWKFQRPCLICTKWMWGDLVWIIPITSQCNKNFSKYLIKIENYKKFGLKYESYFCINNFKIISKKRLVKRVNDFHRWKYIQPISKIFIKDILLKKLYNILQ